jgi:hypothetical protein
VGLPTSRTSLSSSGLSLPAEMQVMVLLIFKKFRLNRNYSLLVFVGE